MKNTKKTTPLFPRFHLQTLRRKRRSSKQRLAEEIELLKQKTFKQTGEMFGKFIPDKELRPEKDGAMSRFRLFSKENTFWAFFSQVISLDGGCKEVVRKLQAYASARGVKLPSSSTASYCTARKKLEEQTLESVFQHTSDELVPFPVPNIRELSGVPSPLHETPRFRDGGSKNETSVVR